MLHLHYPDDLSVRGNSEKSFFCSILEMVLIRRESLQQLLCIDNQAQYTYIEKLLAINQTLLWYNNDLKYTQYVLHTHSCCRSSFMFLFFFLFLCCSYPAMTILSNALLPNILQNQMCTVGPCTCECIWKQKFDFFKLEKQVYPNSIRYILIIPRKDE